MPAEIDPSERERLLRDVDADLDRLRRARPRRRDPLDESWTEAILFDVLTSITHRLITRLLAIVWVAVVLYIGVCAAT
jgi:hypothetical protein